MSALEFMSLDADSQAVIARTPMERRAVGAGARLERRDGWSVAVGYGDYEIERRRVTETVGFADRSNLTKLELHGPADAVATLGLTPGMAASRDGAWWCPVTPTRVLVLGAPAAGLPAELTGESTTALDLSSALAAMTLAGPGANELLARFCAIDVRPSVMAVAAFRPGSVARTPGYVLREREDRLLVLVGWALGEYLWEVVADAAEHLGGGPVGADALREPADA